MRANHLTRMVRFCTVVLLISAVLAACAGSPQPGPPGSGPPVGEATSSSGTGARGYPQPPGSEPPGADHARRTGGRRPAGGGWRVGARPLPLRPDGFGKVLPTPAALRDRRLPTLDRLPPPPGGRFRSSIRPVSPAVRARMGTTWKPGCPVGLADLRYVTVSFRGFDGRAHTGELVVHRRVAAGVVSVFARLYRARFPIEEMRLVTGADLDGPAHRRRQQHRRLRLPRRPQADPLVGPCLRPGHRRRPVPEPLPARRPGPARAGQRLPGPWRPPPGDDPPRRRRHHRLRRHRLDLGRHLAHTQGPDALFRDRRLAAARWLGRTRGRRPGPSGRRRPGWWRR